MLWSELKGMDVEIDSSASPRTSFLGILAIHPQVVWVVLSSMDPVASRDSTLLNLLREILEHP